MQLLCTCGRSNHADPSTACVCACGRIWTYERSQFEDDWHCIGTTNKPTAAGIAVEGEAPNPSDQRAGASPASVHRVVGCKLSNGENP